ncbi:MAG: hypothetical protein ACRDCE_22880 [Cetobacterium sp.]|uniref:hypothetical protein n=1 Tax=Cetobacterium sp. TaxID=2071632 RepID=UPI003EE6A489
MDKEHFSNLCSMIVSPFEEIVSEIQKEMEAQAFKTSDYDTLRIEYAFLSKLLQRLKNEVPQD